MKRATVVLIGFASLAVAFSVALNVVQAKRIIELQREVENGGRSSGLAPGVRVPDLRARDSQGREITLRFDSTSSKPTVLYAFSPACVWCRRNAGDFNSLVAQASGRYTFIGLALNRQGLQEFVAEHGLKVPVYEALDAPGFSSTPQTVVVSPNGAVVATWSGAFLGATKTQVERFFGVRLPDQDL
jgi:peroxiredoxin